ncbi:MAG: choice-of-anchor J domain-containing protein [Bacteroidales bacterium]|nr:choice-of-anchor J domain-containing protein [Bacteroidales bacterium]
MKNLNIFSLIILIGVFALSSYPQQIIYWSDSFESGLGDWVVSNGTWQTGTPISGPNAAYSGTQCAATVLNGNYQNKVNSRLISPTFTIPSADQNPRLRFWHWFDIYYGDEGSVQIKVGAGDWQTISELYYQGGLVWTQTSFDLSAFADSTVQIAFYFTSDGVNEYPGWYIDDVAIITGQPIYNNPESWEMGMGDWYCDRGTWEVGSPTTGPGAAYTGQNCIATGLNSDYYAWANSRFISPTFTIPSADQNPRLRFWHWHDIISEDFGKVQIKVQGSPDWIDLHEYTGTSGGVWTYPWIDLSAFADSTVQIAFYFNSGDGYSHSSGWYIDDVLIEDNSNLNVSTGPDKYIAYGGSQLLLTSVSGGTTPYSFQWLPTTGLNDPAIQNPTASPTTTATYQLKVTDANGCFRTDEVTVYVYFTLTLHAFLEGPFNGSSMSNLLNSNGYLPLSQPFNEAPWYYTGTENVSSIPNADIVDWVLIELRQTPFDASTARYFTMIDRQAAFIKDDGSIVGIDGSYTPYFDVPVTENLYVVLWHRNHLGILSANALLNDNGNYIYDFTSSETNTYGGKSGCKEVASGVWAMPGSDGNANGQIENWDKNNIWLQQYNETGYVQGDYNLNGSVESIDKSDFWNANAGKASQVPKEQTINVALGSNFAFASAISTGTYQGITHYPYLANDGDESTFWASNFSMPAWLAIEFKQIYNIEKLGVWWGAHQHEFTISLSVDGISWTVVVPTQLSPNFEGSPPVYNQFRINSTLAKFVKIDITSTSAPGSHIFQAIIGELEAFSQAID